MDIIKNKMLANLEKQNLQNVDEAYEDWQTLLALLPEYQDQERFLRHYYNAFKVYPDKSIKKYTRATKSNLIKIYEHYIKNGARDIFEDLLDKSNYYNRFIEPESYGNGKSTKSMIDLNRIGSAPSYLLLLYLYSIEDNKYKNKSKVIEEVLEILVKYYLRRNVTDFPNTRDLDAINIEVIEKCQANINSGGTLDCDFISYSLLNGKGKPSNIMSFKEKLEDNLYNSNTAIARYVLAKIDELSHSKEYKPDLWMRNEKGLLVWTIEHILPQGNNIPDCWVQMLANGDKEEANEIHTRLVHSLGNLTLSGYNSKLSNGCFEEKQELHENKKFLGQQINIGYKNGLSLNNLEFEYDNEVTSLSKIDEWNAESILERNKVMVEIILKVFAFSEDEIKLIEKHESKTEETKPA